MTLFTKRARRRPFLTCNSKAKTLCHQVPDYDTGGWTDQVIEPPFRFLFNYGNVEHGGTVFQPAFQRVTGPWSEPSIEGPDGGQVHDPGPRVCTGTRLL